MAESENAWIFDSLVCFLNGPVWNAPLQSFIEEKSLIFEPNANDNPDYASIFEDFKNLVDLMLSTYMDDIGISPVQFEEACNKGHSEFAPRHFDQNLFEQIWAANDYEMFKRMMAQRNVELQLQALELIEQKYGITPQSFMPNKENTPYIHGETTVEISKASASDKFSADLEEEVMEEVSKQFPKEDIYEEEPIKPPKEEVQYIMEEKHILQEALKSIDKTFKEKSEKSDEIINEPETTTKTTRDEMAFMKKPSGNEIDKIELKKRQEYLRAQRDKLVALKKEVRKKQLEVNAVTTDKLKNRPKSAKVAAAVLSGASTNIDPQQLHIRKALADRLRSEVISNKE